MDIKEARTRVRNASVDLQELNSGYLFRFDDSSIYPSLSQFVEHEKECCTFLDFDINDEETTINCRVTLNNNTLDTDRVKEVILALFSTE